MYNLLVHQRGQLYRHGRTCKLSNDAPIFFVIIKANLLGEARALSLCKAFSSDFLHHPPQLSFKCTNVKLASKNLQ